MDKSFFFIEICGPSCPDWLIMLYMAEVVVPFSCSASIDFCLQLRFNKLFVRVFYTRQLLSDIPYFIHEHSHCFILVRISRLPSLDFFY